jgi:hypothetical protein
LVEEDVFPVTAFGRKVLEVAVGVDAVFLAELLPELLANYEDVSLFVADMRRELFNVIATSRTFMVMEDENGRCAYRCYRTGRPAVLLFLYYKVR